MCPATLSNKAGKWLHAALHALPHPRGFISLAEQQQLETANQHAVSKGRLRWQLRARVTRSACCHLVIGAHCQRNNQPAPSPARLSTDVNPLPLPLRHIQGGGVLNHPNTHTLPNPCMMFFSMIPPPVALFFFSLPSLCWEKKSKQQQTSLVDLMTVAVVVSISLLLDASSTALQVQSQSISFAFFLIQRSEGLLPAFESTNGTPVKPI